MTTYSVTNYKGHDTHDGVAWACDLLRDGTFIAHAENSGRGGCNLYHFQDRDEQAAFVAHAKTQVGTDIITFEHEDWYLDDLIARVELTEALNRKRVHVFLLDGDPDYFTTGDARSLPAKLTRDQALTVLRGPRYAGKGAKLWDKTTSAFVAV
jgi:hypothetical protein